MRKRKIVITLIILCLCFKGIAQLSQNQEKQIVIGTVDSLYSNILQEQREIWIHIPEDFDNTKQYPVIYVLDASQHFYVITGMLKQLIPWQIPKSIIVGITNTDRTRDFTHTNVPFQRGHESKTSGGASNFIKFIDEELKPYINNKYPTENNNTIIGHSTGGLFVLYSFLHHENSFDNYLAIDPSLWWDKENLVNETQELLNKGNRKENSLYIAVANSIGKAMDTVEVRKDKTVPTEQIRANLKFHDLLVKNSKELSFAWEYFKNEDHGSVVVPAQYNGLRSIFSWFPFPEMWRFNTPKEYSIKQLTEPFQAHYKKLSIRMKREVKPDWQLLNDIGFFMLDGHNLPEKAFAYLKMNADFYPNESKSFVALGNYFLSQKDKLEATKYYKKAVEIDANQDAQSKLKELGEQ
ncbi:alpha/beta hydrolase-fold protein [Flavobacteriaceae bacterium S0825]|uniref:alpha/beta hydrolase-fold protein n=1 Tax=Gaetbulibacter sp. S0825 TaxID=2720084 RepID=UPI00142FB86A|nr:alpha/beta hydrolase-fold protein [Gaetbulibacter sp. S0825]MCK0110494.1 alpha/beta hydrolase-fold protein [Flavobacteriaceae bacterium S0825]NIX66123.1 prolyl oligopeptidase family serine peptidase [Gaetbulibacter sp. S0825]